MVKKIKKRKKSKKTKRSPYKKISRKINLAPGEVAVWKGSKDGKTWEELPPEYIPNIGGAIDVLGVPLMMTANPQDLDEAVENLFVDAINGAGDQGMRKLELKLNDCKHKVYAARYHLLTFLNEIQSQVEEYSKRPAEKWGVDHERLNPVLVYETEAFLFQVRSNLDLIIQALGAVVPCLEPFDGASKEAVAALERSDEKKLAEYFRSEYDRWIKKLKQWRDTITHYSGLKDFRCFRRTLPGWG